MAIYYLENFENREAVSISELESLLSDNRIGIRNVSIISSINQLLNEDKIMIITNENGRRYSLTRSGLETLENLSEGGIGTPPPEELSKRDAAEAYEELYEENKEIRDELREVRTAARKWRRISWLWRIDSFLTGSVLGTGLLQLVLLHM